MLKHANIVSANGKILSLFICRCIYRRKSVKTLPAEMLERCRIKFLTQRHFRAKFTAFFCCILRAFAWVKVSYTNTAYACNLRRQSFTNWSMFVQSYNIKQNLHCCRSVITKLVSDNDEDYLFIYLSISGKGQKPLTCRYKSVQWTFTHGKQ